MVMQSQVVFWMVKNCDLVADLSMVLTDMTTFYSIYSSPF